jgi:hypothetical protein
MIIVTGTKRSGTSLWMQILIAAGFPYIGKPFSQGWEKSIKGANSHGFFESKLRGGIHHKTNPHPQTGAYLPALETQKHAVKVFIPGLIQSERLYLHRVVATMRHWREYWSSLERLNTIEQHYLEQVKPKGPHVSQAELAELRRSPLHPVLEWWHENYLLIRDYSTRRYPFHCLAYEQLLSQPEEHLPTILRWCNSSLPSDFTQLGRAQTEATLSLNIEAAIAAVKPQAQTQKRAGLPDRSFPLPAHIEGIFDDFYACFTRDAQLSSALIEDMNRCNEELEPLIKDEIRKHQLKVGQIRAQRGLSDQDVAELPLNRE